MQLTLDTSWWTRYRSSTPKFRFPQAVPDVNKGQFTAIPRSDAAGVAVGDVAPNLSFSIWTIQNLRS
jgi:hypothetical protein